MGLAGAARRRVKTYSKGMRQRLGLAQALLGTPRLLLLDEPTVGLDPIATQALYQLIERLRSQGTSIILCSHVLPGVERYIDRAAILANGRLQAVGDLPSLRAAAGLPTLIRASGLSQAQHWQARLSEAGHSASSSAEGLLEVAAHNGHKLGPVASVAGRRTGRGRGNPAAVLGGPVLLLHAACRKHRTCRGVVMNQIWNIARKELSDGLRNRWLLAISLLFAMLAAAGHAAAPGREDRGKPGHPAAADAGGGALPGAGGRPALPGAAPVAGSARAVVATLPDAFAGALFALWLAGETWNISSLVGMIGLLGVAVQNSLVLITQAKGSWPRARPSRRPCAKPAWGACGPSS